MAMRKLTKEETEKGDNVEGPEGIKTRSNKNQQMIRERRRDEKGRD